MPDNSTQTDFAVTMLDQLHILRHCLEQEPENEEEILRDTHRIFEEIKHLSFHTVASELKLCATIASKCQNIDRFALFELAWKMVNKYLLHCSNDIELQEAYASMRDKFLSQNKEGYQEILPVLSNIFDESIKLSASDDTHDLYQETSDASSVGVQANIRVIPPKQKHTTNGSFSLDELDERFKKIINTIAIEKNLFKKEYWSFITDVQDHVFSLKREFLLSDVVGEQYDHPLIRSLHFSLNVHATLIYYFKYQSNERLPDLYAILRNYASLSHTLYHYYKQMGVSAAEQEAAKMNANDAQTSVMRVKDILFCQNVLSSESISEAAKTRAEQIKDFQYISYQQSYLTDHLVALKVNQQLSEQTYHYFMQYRDAVNSSYPPMSYFSLYTSVTMYLEHTLCQYIGPNINVLHVDDNYLDANLSLVGTTLRMSFTQERAHLLKVLELFYDIKAKYAAEQSQEQHAQFESQTRIDAYRYLLTQQVDVEPEKQIIDYQRMMREDCCGSSLIYALAAYQLECVQENLMMQVTQDIQLVSNCDAEEKKALRQAIFTPSKSEKKQQKKKKQKEKKELARKTLNELDSIYQIQLPFSPEWVTCRNTLKTFIEQKKYDEAKSLIDETMASLTQPEQYDAYMLQADALKGKRLYQDALKVITLAVSKLASSNEKRLYYTQKEKILLAQNKLHFLSGEINLARAADDEVKRLASQQGTFCFPWLLEELQSLPLKRLAINYYSDTIYALTDRQRVLLLNEYNQDAFFEFYNQLANTYFERGEEVSKERKPPRSARAFFTDSIKILSALVLYAKLYQQDNVSSFEKTLLQCYEKAQNILLESKWEPEIDDTLSEILILALKKNTDALALSSQGMTFFNGTQQNHIDSCHESYLAEKNKMTFEQQASSQLQDQMVELIRKHSIFEHMKNTITMIKQFYPQADKIIDQSERTAFFKRIDTFDVALMSTIQLILNTLQARYDTCLTQTNDENMPPEALVYLHNVVLHYVVWLTQIKNEQSMNNTIPTSRANLISCLVSYHEQYKQLKKKLSQYTIKNSQVEELVYATSVQQQQMALTLNLTDINPLIAKTNWLVLFEMLKEIHHGFDYSKKPQAYVVAATVVDWLLEQMCIVVLPEMKTMDEWFGLDSVFCQFKGICRTFYTHANQGIITNDSINTAKQKVEERRLPYFVEENLDEKESMNP